jgi:hypothetical protein
VIKGYNVLDKKKETTNIHRTMHNNSRDMCMSNSKIDDDIGMMFMGQILKILKRLHDSDDAKNKI